MASENSNDIQRKLGEVYQEMFKIINFLAFSDQIFQGDIFSGIISHIVDHEVFYVVKVESTVALSQMQEYLEKTEPAKMFWYPSCYEKFLINMEEEYFRAKRVPLTDHTQKDTECMQTYLIDTGETFLVPMSGLEAMDVFLVIPDQFNDIPALAKKCKWVESGIDDDPDSKLGFLNEHLLKNILTFEAMKIKGETVLTKIYPCEDENSDDENASDIAEDLEATLKFEVENCGNDMFTADEINELYEEPLDTENALIAVQGFATKEDERLCRFYDPKTGGCFKGSLCKLQHLPLSTDSYECRDRQEVFVHKENYDLIVPKKHYDIKITFMIAVNRFIFRFNDPDYQAKLGDIQAKINDKEEVKAYKKISLIPEISQLVLVKINEEFKRGKVMDIINEDSYIVWCLDEGCLKSVKMNFLYDWNIRLQDYKNLTHEMEISDIISLKDNDVQGKLRLMEIQRKSGTIKALMM